jgi:hypothetical protein
MTSPRWRREGRVGTSARPKARHRRNLSSLRLSPVDMILRTLERTDILCRRCDRRRQASKSHGDNADSHNHFRPSFLPLLSQSSGPGGA